jgi:hypothetical protein
VHWCVDAAEAAAIGMQDMRGVWRLKTAAPGATLRLSVAVQHPQHGAFFDAVLSLQRMPSLNCSRQRWLLGCPHRVALWIYWQAALLLWKVRVALCVRLALAAQVASPAHPRFSLSTSIECGFR